MKKSGLSLAIITTLFLTSFVSAISYYYDRFSLTGLFDSISSENMVLFFFFIIVLTMVGIILKRVPLFTDRMGNPSRGPIAILALSIATLATYGIYKSGWEIANILPNVGISADSLYPVMSIILIIAFALMLWQFRVGWSLIIIGLLTLIVVFFTDAIYEEGIASVFGIVALLLGFWMKARSNRKLMAAGRYVGSQTGSWYRGQELSMHQQIRGGTHVLVLGILMIILGFLWSFWLIFIGIALAIIGFVLRKRP